MVAGVTEQGKTTFLKASLLKYFHDISRVSSMLAENSVTTVVISEMVSEKLDADEGSCEVFLYDIPGYGKEICKCEINIQLYLKM